MKVLKVKSEAVSSYLTEATNGVFTHSAILIETSLKFSLHAKSEAKFSNMFSSDVSSFASETLCVACALKWEIF